MIYFQTTPKNLTSVSVTADYGNTFVFNLNMVVGDSSAFLSGRVQGSYTWGDSTPPVSFESPPTDAKATPINISDAHTYKAGKYVFGVTASNFSGDQAEMQILLSIAPRALSVASVPSVVGPILPKDSGYPNTNQWCLNSGTDTAVLESAVKMCLMTGVGESLGNPRYGTRLRSIVFNYNDADAAYFAKEEITSALGTYVPLVQVNSVDTSKAGKAINVAVACSSKITGQPFAVTVTFSR